jgi:flavin reductase (DIM6/NTAB) family NADH-FMN oxidoreductase RutF
MQFSLADLPGKARYKLLTATVVPRPIAWVSSLSADGTLNLAPFSYFNVVSSDPPVLLFSVGQRDSVTAKDTLTNIEHAREFVVNTVSERVLEVMNTSAINAPPNVSEFELAQVTPEPSAVIATPRVLESPVSFECKLFDLYRINQNTVIFGEVLAMHVDDDIYLGDYKIDMLRLKPVGRLAGATYSLQGEVVALERPVYKP